MAESVFNYERDVAPMRNNFFSDVARPAGGSRFTYATPDSLRYTAGVLAPAQAALRQAEEDERKRREEDLMFERNKFLLEQGKEEARREAERLAMEPELQKRLEEISAMTSSDPVKAQSALSSFVIKNSSVVGKSEGIRSAVTQLSEVINNSTDQIKRKDNELLNQVSVWYTADAKKAAELGAQISDPLLQQRAAALISSFQTEIKNKASLNAAEEAKKQAEDVADKKEKSFMYWREAVLNLEPDVEVPDLASEGGATYKFSQKSLDYLRVGAIEVGIPDEEINEGLKNDPGGLRQKIIDKTTIGLEGGKAGAKMRGVAAGMLPSTPP